MNDPRRRTSWGCWLVVIGLWAFIGIIFYSMFGDARRPPSRSAQCRNNLRQIGLAMHAYQEDWGALPRTATLQAPQGKAWPDRILEYIKTKGILTCPESPEGLLTYSFNSRVSGLDTRHAAALASEVALVFDSVNNSPKNNNLNGDAVWRSSVGWLPFPGSLVIWPDSQACRDWPKWAKPRHYGSALILFMDGHVQTADDMIRVEFDPKAKEE